jgi:hypothetical protein
MMSDHDRGAYAPPNADTPLTFDARQPVRGSRPFPITLILSGLVLVGLVVMIFAFYRSGVRSAGQAPQAVGAPVGELKSPAPADAQPQDPAAGLQIYRAEANQPAQPAAAQPQFTAPPEQPAPRPAQTTTTTTTAAPAPAPAPVVRQAVLAPPAAPPVPARPVAAEPRPVVAEAPPPAKLPVLRAPAETPAPAKVAAAKPAPVKPATAKPAPAKPTVEAATGGAAAVQIGAVSSTALADKAWNEAVAAAPGLAAGKGKGVEKIERDGKTLYRTAVTGFDSKADAAAFCGRLKAAGKACFVK